MDRQTDPLSRWVCTHRCNPVLQRQGQGLLQMTGMYERGRSAWVHTLEVNARELVDQGYIELGRGRYTKERSEVGKEQTVWR